MTIVEAVQTVLKEAGRPMSTQEIYDEILKQGLYTFNAKNPKGVMSQAIRERSDAKTNPKVLMFKAIGQGTYALID